MSPDDSRLTPEQAKMIDVADAICRSPELTNVFQRLQDFEEEVERSFNQQRQDIQALREDLQND